MIEDITRRVDAELRKVFGTNRTVLNFLLRHERKGVLIRNLAAEISRAEKLSINVDLTKYQMVIRDFSKLFARAAIEHCEQQNLSAAEKARRVWDADHLKRASEHLIDLEKETLNANRGEDWAEREIKARSEVTIQERVLREVD